MADGHWPHILTSTYYFVGRVDFRLQTTKGTLSQLKRVCLVNLYLSNLTKYDKISRGLDMNRRIQVRCRKKFSHISTSSTLWVLSLYLIYTEWASHFSIDVIRVKECEYECEVQ